MIMRVACIVMWIAGLGGGARRHFCLYGHINVSLASLLLPPANVLVIMVIRLKVSVKLIA